jgi:hypothetical protein
MKNKPIIATTILLFIGISLLFGQPGNPDTPEKTVPEWKQTKHDFGEIEYNKPVKAEFIFKNPTLDPILVSSVKASCGCTVADYPKNPVKPGESAKVTVTYNARNVGRFKKSVRVDFNKTGTTTTLFVEGIVKKSG